MIQSRIRQVVAPYCFLLPNLLGFMLFTSIPVAGSLMLSFCAWDLLSWPPRFVGLANFNRLVGFERIGSATSAWLILGALVLLMVILILWLNLLVRTWHRPLWRFAYRSSQLAIATILVLGIHRLGHLTLTESWRPNDPEFWRFFYNTLFLMGGIPIGMGLSLMLALVMNQKLRGMVFFRTIFFLPNFCAGVAIVLLWKWLYNADFGLVNRLLESGGALIGLQLQGPDWLGNPFWAKPALILMGLWTGVGGLNMILYLAALQNINPEFYEAAGIDGAGPWQKFWAITWPMISPTTFFITIISVISGFQGGFEAVFIMTQGGPAGSTTTMSYYIYNNAYVFYRMGYAAAIAWFLFICVFSVTMVNWRYGGRLVHYE